MGRREPSTVTERHGRMRRKPRITRSSPGIRRALVDVMAWKAGLLLLFLGGLTGMAAASGSRLGIDFSRGIHYGDLIGTDDSGAAYFSDVALVPCGNEEIVLPFACVTKVAGDGHTVVRQSRVPGFSAGLLVDAHGGLYVLTPNVNGTAYVERLSTDWTSAAWMVPYTGAATRFTMDASGRVYVAFNQSSQTTVVRVKADGSGLDYTAHVAGAIQGLAADGAGSAILLIGTDEGTMVVAKLSADGSSQSWSTKVPGTSSQIAADPAGDVALLADGQLLHLSPEGIQIAAQSLPELPLMAEVMIPGLGDPVPALAMDAAGNTYVAGFFLAHSVKNSLVPCGGSSLLVYGPDGSLIQSTYLPDSGPFTYNRAALATGTGAAVYVLGAGDPATLIRLSPNANAATFPLACVAHAASYQTGAIAPGEIVVLYGNGLGPQEGIQTRASMEVPFPKQVANVQATFDGIPAPLLWVQDGQINAIAPWGLQPGQNTSVCVVSGSTATNCLQLPVAASAPGVFMVDRYNAVAINQDGTVNSAANPAHLFEALTLYATGLGPISPLQPDGALVGMPLPLNVLQVDVTGIHRPDQLYGYFTVEYAGPAPFEVAGVSQLNLRLNYPLPPAMSVLTLPDNATSNMFNVYVTMQQ